MLKIQLSHKLNEDGITLMNSWLVSQQQMLSQQLTAGVLPHAILITGSKGAGKYQLAQWLVELLICRTPNIENDISTA